LRGQITPAPGRESEFEAVLEELVAVVRDRDPGTISYGFYRDARSGRYVVIEQYADAAAIRAHLANVGPLIGRIAGLAVPGGDPLEIFAEPSGELDELYGAWNPVYLPPHARV